MLFYLKRFKSATKKCLCNLLKMPLVFLNHLVKMVKTAYYGHLPICIFSQSTHNSFFKITMIFYNVNTSSIKCV